MAYTESKTPDHFLIRWNEETGLVQGAQVGFIEKVFKDGVLISARQGDPISVAMADESGFPLKAVLGEINTAALTQLELQSKELIRLLAELQETKDALAIAMTRME